MCYYIRARLMSPPRNGGHGFTPRPRLANAALLREGGIFFACQPYTEPGRGESLPDGERLHRSGAVQPPSGSAVLNFAVAKFRTNNEPLRHGLSSSLDCSYSRPLAGYRSTARALIGNSPPAGGELPAALPPPLPGSSPAPLSARSAELARSGALSHGIICMLSSPAPMGPLR